MMTNLFRRSNVNRNHGSGTQEGNAASGELSNRRPPRQVRRLEFSQAMDDFKTMFPQHGAWGHRVCLEGQPWCGWLHHWPAIADELGQPGHGWQLGFRGQHPSRGEFRNFYWDLKVWHFYILVHKIIFLSNLLQILERTLEPDSSDEEPPPIYAPPSYDMHIYDRKHPADVPSTPPPRQEEFLFMVPIGRNE